MLGNVQDIDLKLLRIFRAVVANGGFAAAQVELGVSLPTISTQIRQLEERLGLRLCERGSAGFRLTDAGQRLMAASDQLFSAVDNFQLDLVEVARKPVGELRLGVVDFLSTDPSCRIPDAIGALHRRYPGVSVRYFVGPPSELESRTLNGELDLAIGLFPNVAEAVDGDRLFSETHGLFCSSDHPLFTLAGDASDRADLWTAPYVSWAYQEDYLAGPERGRFHTAAATPYMEGLFYAVLSGAFIGFLPIHATRSWVESGRLRQLGGEPMVRRRDVVLIRKRSKRHNPIVEALREALITAHRKVAGCPDA
jgi:DNA-binding transcriptional LysR family regulator